MIEVSSDTQRSVTLALVCLTLYGYLFSCNSPTSVVLALGVCLHEQYKGITLTYLHGEKMRTWT